jgi:hypothetical protein
MEATFDKIINAKWHMIKPVLVPLEAALIVGTPVRYQLTKHYHLQANYPP